jgi:hypothetical protein
MDLHSRIALAAAAVVAVACGATPTPPSSADSWAGTTTTEGNATTTVTESGSVWGGNATLVEEASIGVESGATPYMLGRVWGIAADDERIYVLDSQAPSLRVYDLDGTHVGDIGAEGEGPGEYLQPDGLALGPDGRIYVRVFRRQRINVYDNDGAYVAALQDRANFMHQRGDFRALADGTVYARARDSFVGFSPEGAVIEPIPYPVYERQPLTAQSVGDPTPSTLLVPFSPWSYTTLSPAGAIVSGFSDAYRFTIAFRDGRTTIVERRVAPVPVQAEERAWHEARFRQDLMDAGGIAGEIPSIPEHKPSFARLITTHDGRVWVVRPGPGRRNDDCPSFRSPGPTTVPTSCWQDSRLVDVFEIETGRYLGEVALPEGLATNPEPHIDGDRVVAAFQDDAGTIIVKRYRLVLPGEGEGSIGPKE